jgi:hypothetical protein
MGCKTKREPATKYNTENTMGGDLEEQGLPEQEKVWDKV